MKQTRFHAIVTAALAVWLSAVVAAGYAAAVTFPTLKKLDVRIPAYEAFQGEHWRIAGGKVALNMFMASDFVQPAMALIAAVVLLLVRPRECSPAWAAWARLLFVAIGIGLFLWYVAMIRVPMQHAIDGFWLSLDGGKYEEAATFQGEFDALHPASSRTLSLIAASVLLALFSSLITAPKEPLR